VERYRQQTWQHFGRFQQMCEKRLLASSRLSVRPSIGIEQLSSPGRIFMKFDEYFSKTRQNLISSKSDTNNEASHEK
jgi:hypothetical protein